MNAFIIERLANQLKKILTGSTLIEAFTTSSEDIFLVFDVVVLKVSFFQGQAYFQTPDVQKLQKKNRLNVYKTLSGKNVVSVQSFPFDRIFKIKFKKGESLSFQLFGRFGQITHYKNGEWAETFPVKNAKRDVEPEYQFEIGDKQARELKFLTKDQVSELVNNGFDEKASEEKYVQLVNLKNRIVEQPLFLNKGDKKYTLDYVIGEDNIAKSYNVLEALDQHSRLYISHQIFTQTKSSHLGKLRKELTLIRRKLKSASRNIEELQRADSYKEKADLLMANMWQIEKRQKVVSLTSFDGSRDVTIKLKENLTPQLNAERYYRKAKNESKQREFALKHLKDLEEKEHAKIREMEEFEALESFKTIKKIAVSSESKIHVKRPYREMTIDGFEIRIGKGAKENDELLRSHSSKTDVWFHAKDVSGSHVLLRNPAKKQLLTSTLEKVAGIAAYYSKAKNDTLAAVIYTDRKYIRKPKGANPGMVKVDKEKVILVEPINPSH